MWQRLIMGAAICGLTSNATASPWMCDDSSVEIMVDKLSQAVVWVYNQNSQMFATGALVLMTSEKTQKALLVSNYHVLRSTSDVINFWIFDGGGKPVRQRAGFWAGDPTTDIALFELRVDDVRGITNENGVLTIAKSNRAIEEGNISDGAEIRRGRSIVFLGFPLNHGVAMESGKDGTPQLSQKVPVLKHGKVALEVSSDWILVDGMNNHGNSGSPVFARAETETGDPTFKMIGIMSSFEPDTAGEITFPDGGRASIPHNSGLARVASIHAIRKLFRQGMKKELAASNGKR